TMNNEEIALNNKEQNHVISEINTLIEILDVWYMFINVFGAGFPTVLLILLLQQVRSIRKKFKNIKNKLEDKIKKFNEFINKFLSYSVIKIKEFLTSLPKRL